MSPSQMYVPILYDLFMKGKLDKDSYWKFMRKLAQWDAGYINMKTPKVASIDF